MKALKDIIYKVSLLSTIGDMDSNVRDIAFDSRKVQKGTALAAIKGTQTDGHAYIDQAVETGATVIICEDMPQQEAEGVAYVQVADSAKALGIMASNFDDQPSEKLKVVASTGTNGK